MDTAAEEFAPVSKIDEGSLAPEFWQNITCADEVPVDDYFDNKKYFHNEKDLELSYFDQDPLLADLEFSAEIPRHGVFQRNFQCMSKEEAVMDNLSLHQDSRITAGENLLLLMHHTTSIEDLYDGELYNHACPPLVSNH